MAKVLVVENDNDTAQLLATRLRGYGHSVLTAPSGKIALAEVGFDFPADVALLDIHLSGMDGFEILEELRRHPEIDNPKLPAVFLSGSRAPEHLAKAEELGCTYLTKPFISGELQGALLVALNGLPS